MIENALQFQVDLIKRNRLVFFFLLLIAGTVIIEGIAKGTLLKVLIYLAVVWLYAFIVDVSCINSPSSADLPVKRPVSEAIYALTFLIVWLAYASFINLQNAMLLISLPVVYFIGVLGKLVGADNYRLHDLGFRSQKILLAIPAFISFSYSLIYLFSIPSMIVGITFLSTLFNMLSIEFFRMLGQSRLVVIVKNFGVAWFIATL